MNLGARIANIAIENKPIIADTTDLYVVEAKNMGENLVCATKLSAFELAKGLLELRIETDVRVTLNKKPLHRFLGN